MPHVLCCGSFLVAGVERTRRGVFAHRMCCLFIPKEACCLQHAKSCEKRCDGGQNNTLHPFTALWRLRQRMERVYVTVCLCVGFCATLRGNTSSRCTLIIQARILSLEAGEYPSCETNMALRSGFPKQATLHTQQCRFTHTTNG